MADEPAPEVEAIAAWISEAAARYGSLVQEEGSAYVPPDCALRQDVPLPGGLTPGHLAWRGIATAGEHVGAMNHMTSTSGNGVRVKPFLSLARATMLGAARGLYILEPEKPEERRARALQLFNSEVEDLHRLIGDLEAAKHSPDVAESRLEVDTLRAESRQELVAAGLKPGSKISETSLLLGVAHHLKDGTADPAMSVMDVWRFASGAAHGRSWLWNSGYEDLDPAIGFVRIWSVPMGFLEHAWDLWNVRRGATSNDDAP